MWRERESASEHILYRVVFKNYSAESAPPSKQDLPPSPKEVRIEFNCQVPESPLKKNAEGTEKKKKKKHPHSRRLTSFGAPHVKLALCHTPTSGLGSVHEIASDKVVHLLRQKKKSYKKKEKGRKMKINS